jgi:hypothetical protein
MRILITILKQKIAAAYRSYWNLILLQQMFFAMLTDFHSLAKGQRDLSERSVDRLPLQYRLP